MILGKKNNYQSLFLSYETQRWVIEDTLGCDGPWTGYLLEGGNSKYTDVSLSTKSMTDEYQHTGEPFTVGDTVYVAYAVYGSGGTFGMTYGYLCCVLITKDKAEAEQAQAWIDYVAKKDRALRIGAHLPPPVSPPNVPMGQWVYQSLVGYFCDLQSAELDEFVITE